MSLPRHSFPQLIPQRINGTLTRLRSELWNERVALAVSAGNVHEKPVPAEKAAGERYRPVRPGDTFGAKGGGWAQLWFRLEIPGASNGEQGRRALFWECQGESTVYIDGVPWAGLDAAHPYCPLPDQKRSIFIDCGTYQTGIWGVGVPLSPHTGIRFEQASIRVRNAEIWDIYFDLEVLYEVLRLQLETAGYEVKTGVGFAEPFVKLPPSTRKLLRRLDESCDFADRGDYRSLRTRLQEIYREFPAGAQEGRIAMLGHAHIDLVWLWPEFVTYRKGVHTFSTALRLLERYPEYRFSQSSPLLYRAVEDASPSLMKQIRARISEGKWEATGAMEVEPDVNLPSGEALARNLIHAQQSFTALRGKPSELLWLPDVFGYPNCLPQILSLAEVRYFYTTKLTWSAITRFPHSAFRWRSPDGTFVLAHLSAVGYNEKVSPKSVTEAVHRSMQTGIYDEVLLPMGFGDGGGGTTEEMIERTRRMKNLLGMPKAAWTTAEDYFRRLARSAADLPEYDGELYLEYHRGTYTTQSELKRLYRAAEKALCDHDALNAALQAPPLPGSRWDRVFLSQFHDAIPGSSISRVYEELEPQLAQSARRELSEMRKEIAGAARAGAAPAGTAPGVFEPFPLPRKVLIELPEASPIAAKLLREDALLQKCMSKSAEGAETAVYLAQLNTPGFGFHPLTGAGSIVVSRSAERAPNRELSVSPTALTNGVLSVAFGSDGFPSGIRVDGRAIPLRGARFALYPDFPANYDAWDIDRAALSLGEPVGAPLKLKVVERGPLRAALEGTFKCGESSRITVRYLLEAGSSNLRIESDVDWNEKHRLLKYELQTTCRGRFARFGAPFGSVLRSQVPGSPGDEAQWEVPGQRWAAVMDELAGEGVFIVTEAKYGFAARDGQLSVSLLRAPTMPDPGADIGRHHIRFAIGEYKSTSVFPGSGADEVNAGSIPTGAILSTAAEAEALYANIHVADRVPFDSQPFRIEAIDSLVPSAVKPLESGEPGFALRFHETAGRRGTAVISFAEEPEGVFTSNLLERDRRRAKKQNKRKYMIEFEPYQIVTVVAVMPSS